MLSDAQRLAREIAELRRDVRSLSTVAGLAMSSVEGGPQEIYDENGDIRVIVGEQADGSYTIVDFNAPPPPQPSDPVVEEAAGALVVTWDGATADGSEWPADFSRVEVHVGITDDFVATDLTEWHAFHTTKGGSVTLTLVGGVTHYIRLLAVNRSEKESTATVAVAGTADAVVTDAEIAAIQTEVDAAEAAATQAQSDAAAAQIAASDAVTAANNITDTQILDDAILTRHLSAFAVTAAEIAAGAVEAGKIAAGAVTAGTLAAGAVLAGTIASGAVTTGALDALAVTTDKIASNAVTAGKIDVGAVTAGTIAAGAVQAGNLAAGAVTAGTIAAGALDGITITGAFIRTGVYPDARIDINVAPNPFLGGASWPMIALWNENTAWDPGLLFSDYDNATSEGALSLVAPYPSGTSQPARIRLWTGGTNSRRMAWDANGIDWNIIGSGVADLIVNGSNTFSFRNTGGSKINMQFDFTANRIESRASTGLFPLRLECTDLISEADDVYLNNLAGSGGAVNVQVGNSGRLQRATSSRKFKENVVPLNVDTDAVLALEGRAFTRIDERNNLPHPHTYGGFIAEEAAELGLEPWVVRDEAGEPSAFRYDEFVTAVHAVVKQQQKEIEALKQRLDGPPLG